MTKIEDLATVMLDNALSSFPVDDERYELVAAVRLNAAYSMQHLGLYEHDNWRINEWLNATDTIVHDAAEAFVDWLATDCLVAFPENQQAQALYELLSEDDLGHAQELCCGDTFLLKAELYSLAWKKISIAMRRSEHFTPGSNPQGKLLLDDQARTENLIRAYEVGRAFAKRTGG